MPNTVLNTSTMEIASSADDGAAKSSTRVTHTAVNAEIVEKAKPSLRRASKRELFAGTSLAVLSALSVTCLIVGILVFVVPARWVDSGLVVQPKGATPNNCQEVTPETTPWMPFGSTASRTAFLDAWAAYNKSTIERPEGVRPGCEPMRFPATSAYRGVVVVWHGFTSCPQEMSHLGPALAAKGYDAIFPLMPGHGNALVYKKDAPNFLWAYLGFGFALLGLVVMGFVRVCPCAELCCRCVCCTDDDLAEDARCGKRSRTRCIYTTCALLTILLIVSLVGIFIVTFGTSDADFCLSLSFVDGVGAGCGGMSEYNDNLPKDGDAYRSSIDAINAIVKLAPGSHAVAGLSGGGAAAVSD